jgi:NADH-quinone oxidoreductase subunit E
MANRRLAPQEVQPPAFSFSPETEAFAEAAVKKYPPGRQMSAVVPLLWQVQKQCGGWLPQKAIEAVAQRLGMPYIRVLEVATFYTMFQLEPVGRWFVQLCGTVPCHVKGALDLKDVLRRRVGDEGHVSADGNFSWLEVECLGACCNAPMVQINDDYYEDLTPEILDKLLDDLAAGRPVKPGSQQGRVSSEPQGAVNTLTDPSLYDGSRVGAWRKRFEEQAVKEAGEGVEAAAQTATAPSQPKPAKPDAGRAIESETADTPAKRVKEGEPPLNPDERKDAASPDRATAVEPRQDDKGVTAPQSTKSYTMTPSKPEEGRTVAEAKGTTPEAGTPPAKARKRRGSETKPAGSEIPPQPGVPPTEEK